MIKSFLTLELISHVQVTLRGGAKVIRDDSQSRAADYKECITAIMKRVKKATGDQVTRDTWRSKLVSQLEGMSKPTDVVEATVKKNGRKYFTYRISVRPVGMEFVERARAAQANPKVVDAVIHDGISTPEQKAKALQILAEKRAKRETTATTQGKASAPAQSPKKTTTLAKPQPTAKQDTKLIVFSNAVVKECKRHNVDPNNPPSEKPKGMKNNIWNKIKK